MAAGLQDHIHIGTTLGGTPEFAPAAKYIVFDWGPQDEINLSFKRSWNGVPWWGAIRDGSGYPRKFTNYRYTLKVTTTEWKTLRGLVGRKVYLVDNDHCDDGETHAAYVMQMLLGEISTPDPINAMLEYLTVQLLFVDINTVVPVQLA